MIATNQGALPLLIQIEGRIKVWLSLKGLIVHCVGRGGRKGRTAPEFCHFATRIWPPVPLAVIHDPTCRSTRLVQKTHSNTTWSANRNSRS